MSHFVNLLRRQPADIKNLFRELESQEKKIIRCQWSITFNQVCLQENIMPVYSKIRHHDPAVRHTSHTIEYRKYLIRREKEKRENDKIKLLKDRENIVKQIDECNLQNGERLELVNTLGNLLENSEKVQRVRTIKKLNSLYGASILLKEGKNCFVNLSNYDLSEDEVEFLNLGLNYHMQPKYSRLHKVIEIESLFNTISEMEKGGSISVNSNIVTQLTTESSKHRNPKYKSSIKPNLRDAAKKLKGNKDIIIRKADKSSIYVLLNRGDYMDKVHDIVSDESKFRKISKDPTEGLKREANLLISAQNSVQDCIKIPKIVGDFSPEYLYGNCKIHKPNNPLRPIISQVTTPTYNLAKFINKIITPFMPTKYSLRSTNDFIDLIHSKKCQGTLASLDVESLFTNVPIDETIDIILAYTYDHDSLPPPKISRKILKQILEICTKKAPFRTPNGDLYLQTYGVAMGSPLGPTFANFYMGHLEEKVLNNLEKPPYTYARYVDDIFMEIDDLKQLLDLKSQFENNSVLKFTYEMNLDNKLPFLDVLVDTSNNVFDTKVYRKPTSYDTCLNAESECIERYKKSVITSYLNRAYKVTKTWKDFHDEIIYVKQTLINNNFSNNIVDTSINRFVESKMKKQNESDQISTISLFYKAQMHENYKIDERILKDIIGNNITCKDPHQQLRFLIYYKDNKTSNLVMRNNLNSEYCAAGQTNVVYEFECPFPHAKVETYIGMTASTLHRRLESHTRTGSIQHHFSTEHHIKPTISQLLENTKILAKAENRYKLAVSEALLISYYEPTINRQSDHFTNVLKLHAHVKPNLGIENRYRTTETTDNNVSVTHQNHTREIEYIREKGNNQVIREEENNHGIRSQNIPNLISTDMNPHIDSIPDMNTILCKFGVNYDTLNPVSLKEYRWNVFYKSNVLPDTEEFDQSSFQMTNLYNPRDSPTISQRIRSLRRVARNSQS